MYASSDGQTSLVLCQQRLRYYFSFVCIKNYRWWRVVSCIVCHSTEKLLIPMC